MYDTIQYDIIIKNIICRWPLPLVRERSPPGLLCRPLSLVKPVAGQTSVAGQIAEMSGPGGLGGPVRTGLPGAAGGGMAADWGGLGRGLRPRRAAPRRVVASRRVVSLPPVGLARIDGIPRVRHARQRGGLRGLPLVACWRHGTRGNA